MCVHTVRFYAAVDNGVCTEASVWGKYVSKIVFYASYAAVSVCIFSNACGERWPLQCLGNFSNHSNPSLHANTQHQRTESHAHKARLCHVSSGTNDYIKMILCKQSSAKDLN